jgi:hypothetical protein
MEDLCVCSKRMLHAQDATWMFHGRPCCNRLCYDKAAAAEDRKFAERKAGLRKLAAPRPEEVHHAAA